MYWIFSFIHCCNSMPPESCQQLVDVDTSMLLSEVHLEDTGGFWHQHKYTVTFALLGSGHKNGFSKDLKGQWNMNWFFFLWFYLPQWTNGFLPFAYFLFCKVQDLDWSNYTCSSQDSSKAIGLGNRISTKNFYMEISINGFALLLKWDNS